MNKELINKCIVDIRFSEVDLLGMAWHGNYVKYLEDGRESFGREFGLKYWDVYEHGFITPIVKLNIDYKKSLRYGDQAEIHTKYIHAEAAKIILNYTVFRVQNHDIIATAETIQVFLNLKGELHLTVPDFFLDWKKRLGII